MTTESPTAVKQISRATRELSRLRPSYAEMLSFYENLFIAQENSKKDTQLEPVGLSSELLEVKRQNSLPLLDVSGFTIDSRSGSRLLGKLCELIKAHGTEMDESAAAVDSAVASGELVPKRLFENLLKGDDDFFQTTADRIGAENKVLAFIAYNSIEPSIELCAVQFARYLDNEAVWGKGYCPVCGSAPGLAVMVEEGKRELYCSFCRHRWRAPRIFCAFCENTQNTELHYFFTEEEKELRVDVCDRCRKYIKTVDSRVVSRPVFPPIEQVASLHLDIIAAEKGFISG